MNEPLEIFCDESGQTGPNLLDPQQRLFTFAGVAMGDDEAWEIITRGRGKHRIVDDELKSTSLLKSGNGRRFVHDILEAVEGRYSVVAYDKALALCAKVFEYVYEPVFQDAPELVYAKNLHRFVAMYCFTFFVSKDEMGAEAVQQFLAFMRSYDPKVAPLLFEKAATGGDALEGNPFEMVTAFAEGYRDIIVADNQSERDALRPGTLTLDLACSALFSILCHFGENGRPLAVTCDENAQLEQVAQALVGGDDDPSIRRAQRLFPDTAPKGWTLARPIAFDDSRNRPALQVADLVAGTASAVASGRVHSRELTDHLAMIDRHIHPHAMFPDYSVVRPETREAMVNWLVLRGLGERARAGENPYFLLREMYQMAEDAWDAGELRFGAMGGED